MNAPADTRRARPGAAILVVDGARGRFALPALPDMLPLAMSPVSARSSVEGGEAPGVEARQLGVRSLPPCAFTDAALSAAHTRLGFLFAAPANGVMTLRPRIGLWGRAARHGLAPDRKALSYLGRSLVVLADGARWHLRVFAIPHARAVQALFPATPGGRAVWIEEPEMAARLAQPELAPFVPLAKAAASGIIFTPLHVRNQAGRLRVTRL